MKKDIHPQYHKEAVITCACGNSFKVGSTKTEIRVELCNECHPFYTGKQKFVDTAHRVEKFQEKLEKTKETATKRKGKKAKYAARAKKKEDAGSTVSSTIKKEVSNKKTKAKAVKPKTTKPEPKKTQKPKKDSK